jgi:hypothetical protein
MAPLALAYWAWVILHAIRGGNQGMVTFLCGATGAEQRFNRTFFLKGLTTRHKAFYQAYLPKTASPRQAAYHSIV